MRTDGLKFDGRSYSCPMGCFGARPFTCDHLGRGAGRLPERSRGFQRRAAHAVETGYTEADIRTALGVVVAEVVTAAVAVARCGAEARAREERERRVSAEIAAEREGMALAEQIAWAAGGSAGSRVRVGRFGTVGVFPR